MPELTKEIDRLYFVEKLSYRQVAERLGVADSTVAKRLKKLGGGRSAKESTLLRSSPEYSEKIRITQLGESNSSAKLTEPDVLAIRDIYDNAVNIGKKKYQTELMLAKDFGVGRSTISDIVKLRTWKHI